MFAAFAFLPHVAAFSLVGALVIELFAAIGLLSIYPTRRFVSWRASLRQDTMPAVEPAQLRAIRAVIYWELAGVVVLVLCAALMARGIGHVGA